MGRWIRAAGSNFRAAHVSGIDFSGFICFFVVSGALTGLAGIILTAIFVGSRHAGAQLQFERYRGRCRWWNQPCGGEEHLRDGIRGMAVCHGQQRADPCRGQLLLAVSGDRRDPAPLWRSAW